MTDIQRDGLSVQQERALLVGVILPGSTADPMDPLGELRSLAKTADANVVDEMLANRLKPTPNLYVGTGKAQEIFARAVQNDIDVVIFDNDLSPGQIRELEAVIQRKVLDRSELILDIFACHASTAESRLQIELAQLEYTYPRLRHMWSHLERMAGGSIGTRGPGEKQLETDRRLVQKRVSHLKRQLAEIALSLPEHSWVRARGLPLYSANVSTGWRSRNCCGCSAHSQTLSSAIFVPLK